MLEIEYGDDGLFYVVSTTDYTGYPDYCNDDFPYVTQTDLQRMAGIKCTAYFREKLRSRGIAPDVRLPNVVFYHASRVEEILAELSNRRRS